MIVKFYDAGERGPRGGWIARVYGREYAANSEPGIVDQVRDDLLNNGTYTTDEAIRQVLWAHWCSREPERCSQPSSAQAGFVAEAQDTADGSTPAPWKVSEGAKHWARLHWFARAVHKSGTIDSMAVRMWLENFRRAIGCEDCRSNWSLEVALLPPALGTGQAFFEWTVAVHNSINARVGHAQFPLVEAYALYP